MKYICSDLHFYHNNIIRYSPKTRSRFASVEEMNRFMIDEWNRVVQPDDTVYFLGDFAFCNATKAVNVARQLVGRRVMIAGNHDAKLLDDEMFRDCWDEIHDYLEVKHDGHRIAMFHYPIAQWSSCHRGSIHFHGHLHDSPSGLEKYRCRNVGFDFTGRVVSSLDDMIADALRGDIMPHGSSEEH